MKICNVPDCGQKHWARGYCRKHYRRVMERGRIENLTFEDRFWSKVDRRGADECWPWTGATIKGYGHSHADGKHYYAHRKSWEIANGQDVPSGLVVRHKCDNPPCVNPAHLEVGTQRDNTLDSVSRGRANRARKLTDEDIEFVIGLVDIGIPKQEIACMFEISRSYVNGLAGGYVRRAQASA